MFANFKQAEIIKRSRQKKKQYFWDGFKEVKLMLIVYQAASSNICKKLTLYKFGSSDQIFLALVRHTFLEPELGLLSRGICQINHFRGYP